MTQIIETELATLAWLRLNFLEFSPIKLHTLLTAFGGDPIRLMEASDSAWRERLPDLTSKQMLRLADCRNKTFEKELETLRTLGARVVPYTDPNYPSNLKQLTDCPPVLIVRGTLLPEDKFSLAIVGSRRASAYGLSLAKRFAKDLAAQNLTIVSGGARGIDTRVHQGALEAGGRTVVFIGCGVDVVYPAENKKLFDEIVAGGGAIVSEYPIGIRPEPWRFPARNRLISGMSLGVLVIESPVDSGSMITAREAADQGREVFAIPGPIDTGRNSGCHKLIQDGAKLVESVDDVLIELGILAMRSPDAPPSNLAAAARIVPDLPPEQRLILNMLTLQPRNVDSMIVESGFSAPQVTGILTLLEMRGLARRVPGNAFVRVL